MKIRLEEHLRNRSDYMKKRLRSMQNITRKDCISRRIRSGTEEDILLRLDSMRWKRWIEEGKIVILSRREFRFRLR